VNTCHNYHYEIMTEEGKKKPHPLLAQLLHVSTSLGILCLSGQVLQLLYQEKSKTISFVAFSLVNLILFLFFL